MSEKQSNKKPVRAYKLSRKKRQSVIDTENEILFWVGRFGWLSYYQIGLLVYPNKPTLRAKGEQARLVLERLFSEGFLETSVLTKLEPAKMVAKYRKTNQPSRKPKAYSLSKTGVQRVSFLPKWNGRHSPIYYKNIKPMQAFHRLVSNQLLIDLMFQRLSLPVEYVENWELDLSCFLTRHFRTEVEISEKRNDFKNFFNCQPDGLWWPQEDPNDYDEGCKDDAFKYLFVLEVDNTSRGTRQISKDNYGNKLPGNYFDKNPKMTRWLAELMDVKSSNVHGPLTVYKNEFLLPFDNIVQIFVCTSLAVFRDLYRKTELAELNMYVERARHRLMSSPNHSDVDLSSDGEPVQLMARELRNADRSKDLNYLIFYIVLDESNIKWSDPIVDSGYNVYSYGEDEARVMAQEYSDTINQHHKNYIPEEK